MTANCRMSRIELEHRILSQALRLSWADSDEVGVLKACDELSFIYPDLAADPEAPAAPDTTLSPPARDRGTGSWNYYNVFNIDVDASPSLIRAVYWKYWKLFLRNADPFVADEVFFRILTAGLVLKEERLRLSHDLFVATSRYDRQSKKGLSLIPEELPPLIGALYSKNLIGRVEVEALLNQMDRFPEAPLSELILRAGYASEEELRDLADGLDETSWEQDGYFPPGEPPESQRIPREPSPEAGGTGTSLPLPMD